MAWSLTASTHYLNEFWLIPNEAFWYSHQGKGYLNTQGINCYIEFEICTFVITAISPRGQWVKVQSQLNTTQQYLVYIYRTYWKYGIMDATRPALNKTISLTCHKDKNLCFSKVICFRASGFIIHWTEAAGIFLHNLCVPHAVYFIVSHVMYLCWEHFFYHIAVGKL